MGRRMKEEGSFARRRFGMLCWPAGGLRAGPSDVAIAAGDDE